MAQDRNKERAELQRVLDTYGADRTRWPGLVRTRLEHLIATDAPSRRIVAEARALDRVLDRAPVPGADRSAAVADRLMATLAATPVARAATAPAQPRLESPSRVVQWLRPRSAPFSEEELTPRTAWQAGALIAACLMAGIYLGAATSVLPVMQDVAESVGIVADLDPSGLLGFAEIGDEDSL